MILLQDFITICNLTRENMVVDGHTLAPDCSMAVDLPPNPLKDFNNRMISWDGSNIEQIYTWLFEEVSERTINIHPSCNSP